MKSLLAVVAFLIFAGGVGGLIMMNDESRGDPMAVAQVAPFDRLDAFLVDHDMVLLEDNLPKLEAGVALRTLSYDASQLSRQPILLRKSGTSEVFVCLVADGHPLATFDLKRYTVETSCKLVFDHDRMTALLVDDQVIDGELVECDMFWVSSKDVVKQPVAQVETVAEHIVKDGFMRKELIDDNWAMTEGKWKMKKYGGGMPENEQEMQSDIFQRTVNPFSVLGEGVLTYGKETAIHNRGEASFYFGKPWRVGAVDKDSLPKANFGIAQGRVNGDLYGFGWNAFTRRFVLFHLEKPGADWRILATRNGLRPPISNWVRVGLQIRNGIELEGVLDGVVVLKKSLNTTVSGPFHVVARGGQVEFDDFSIAAMDGAIEKEVPVFVKSRNFSGKTLKSISDPKEFREWAQGESSFIQTTEMTEDGRFKKAVTMCRWPMMGDFSYETVAESTDEGELPPGVYEIQVLKNPSEGLPAYKEMEVLWTHRLVYDDDGWQWGDGDSLAGEPVLRLQRSKANGNQVTVLRKGKSLSVIQRVDAPVHVAVSRLLPKSARLLFPKPEHHVLTSKQWVNEFFEETPVDWNWIDGGFRMDCRWACQNQWNFMACGSTGVPMLVSKRRFHGDQEHQYFMSLRPMLPSDAGDPSFTFNQGLHRRLLRKFNGWYNRRDLNFSFCTDGRNPLSGYSVLYGGKNNSETLLLRKGKVVASTKRELFRESRNHQDVHWKWWGFAVRKYGKRIIVLYRNKPLFDYVDDDPIEGGHLAFWTVRNGFTLSKIVSTAESIDRDPSVLYVENDDDEVVWKPLLRDSVTLFKEGDDMTRVVATVGAGSMAVRYTLRPPKILRRKPVLKLPLTLVKDATVNVHLQIDDKGFVIKVNAPIKGCKVLLTPEFEPDYNFFVAERLEAYDEMKRNEFFQRKVISETAMKRRLLATMMPTDGVIELDVLAALEALGYKGMGLLRSITVGNSSNADYRLCGSGGNRAGACYVVGTPVLSVKEK